LYARSGPGLARQAHGVFAPLSCTCRTIEVSAATPALAQGGIARNHGRLPRRCAFRARRPLWKSDLAMTRLRCAILDDYLKLALNSADWSKIKDRVDLTVFEKPFASQTEAAAALKDFQIVLAMRERTA